MSKSRKFNLDYGNLIGLALRRVVSIEISAIARVEKLCSTSNCSCTRRKIVLITLKCWIIMFENIRLIVIEKYRETDTK